MTQFTRTKPSDIGHIPLFKDLAPSYLEHMILKAHCIQLDAGGFFFMQGEPAEKMFVLEQGRVKLYQSSPDGSQSLIHVITPFTLFALVAMTQTQVYPVSAQAAEDSQAIYWTRQELMEFVTQIPELALNAMRMMADQVKEMQERFRQATSENVERRLAHTLLRLSGQNGKKVEEGVLIDLRLSRQDLAEMSGTTQYTVSRLLNQWEQQGWVICGRERVVVRFPHGLVQIITKEPE